MPAVAVDDHAVGVMQSWFLLEAALDGLQDATFFLLALAVELVEAPGDLTGARGIFHTEEFDHVAGNIHASGRVQAGRDAECDFGGSRRARGGNLCNFE
jgi:hypothetical protein